MFSGNVRWLYLALLMRLLTSSLAAQGRVVDLTSAVPDLAEWKIVASRAGGSLGSSYPPPSQRPVALQMTKCAVKDKELLFSVVIENNRKMEVQIPISPHSKLFDHPGAIEFRELLIQIGTVTNTQDPSTFSPKLLEITLFGHQSIPNTTALLAPGEHLVLLLKSKIPPEDQDLGDLHAHIGGFDVTLSPSMQGYSKRSTWIRSLSAVSESTCSANGVVK